MKCQKNFVNANKSLNNCSTKKNFINNLEIVNGAVECLKMTKQKAEQGCFRFNYFKIGKVFGNQNFTLLLKETQIMKYADFIICLLYFTI